MSSVGEIYHLPPQAIEAEQSVLGCMMLSAEAVDDLVGVVTGDDFYRSDHRCIYDAIIALTVKGRSVDVVTVSDYLSELGSLESVGGLSYLGTITKNTPHTGNVKSYGKIVNERAILRRLIEASNDIIQSCYQPEGMKPDQVLDNADKLISGIMQTSNALDSSHISEHLGEAVDGIEARFKSGGEMVGLPTGFHDLDKAMLGLEGGGMYVIAARPAMGKTALALNMTTNLGINDKALFISMEMPISQLINRLLASTGMVDHSRIRSGKLENEDWPKITSAMSLLIGSGIYVDETPALSVAKISAIAKKRIKRSGKMPIIIDYLQIMGSDDKNKSRYEQVTNFSMGIKALAKTLNVPIIILSQLSRSLEARANKRPIMSDLRESGAIEQDADDVYFLYRDEVYNENTEFKGIAELIMGKSRNSQTITVPLSWDGQHQRFDNLNEMQKNHYMNMQNAPIQFKKKGGLK